MIDFTKLVQKLPLPQEIQEHLFRLLPLPVNPYVPVPSGSEAQILRDAAGLAREADESLSTMHLRLGPEQAAGKVYTTTLLIKRFPQHLKFGHFRSLAFGGLDSIHSVRYTLEIQPIVKNLASKSNEHKLNRLRREIEEAEKLNQIPDSDLVKAYQSLKAMIHEVEYTDNLPFEIWVYITLWAPAVQKLRQAVQEVKSLLAEDKIKVNSLYFEQLQGFQAGMSLGLTPPELLKEYPGRFVTSNPLTYLTPFVNGSISDGSGIYFGNSTRNNSFIFLDLLKGQGGKNIAILGTTGSGKSAAQKTLGQSFLEHGFRVIYFDFNGEFHKWCLENGGAYLDQRTQTGTYIEPMMIYPKVSEMDTNPIDAMIARVMRTISILADTVDEYYLVPCDQAIAQVLKDHNIDREKTETWLDTSLRLTDWYQALCAINTPGAQDLRTRIQRYFEGSQRYLFAKSEPLNLESKMIVIRLSNPDEADEDPRASLVKLTLSLDAVSERIKRDKLIGEWYTAVFLDELQRAIRNPAVEKFLNTWATSIRHQNGLVVTGTNLASIYLGEKAPAQSIWSNSYIKMIFYIEDEEIARLKSSKAVPDPVVAAVQQSYGQHTFMLKVADRNWEQARFELSPLESKLYETRGLKPQKGKTVKTAVSNEMTAERGR